MNNRFHFETLKIFCLVLSVSFSTSAVGSPANKLKAPRFVQRQAKEVLGKEFKANQIQSAVKMPGFQHAIYKTVHKSLVKKYKKDSHHIAETIIKESYKYKFDPVFVMAVIQTESSFNPLAIGSIGEVGLMQIRPETAAWIAEKYKLSYQDAESLKNPITNIQIGVAYLDTLRKSFKGFGQKYVSAYNMGARKVRLITNVAGLVPKEYHSRVVTNYSGIYGRLVASVSTQRRSMTTEMP